MTHPLLTVYLVSQTGFDSPEFSQFKREADEHRLVLELEEDLGRVPVREIYQPMVYVSVGDDCQKFPGLMAIPPKEKGRWINFKDFNQIRIKGLFHCWLHTTDPLPKGHPIKTEWSLSKWPTVSFFTTTFKSGEKIFRPYRTLLRQNYPHWEWIIVDDSDDNGETYSHIKEKIVDPRIKKYRQEKHSGYIGLVKRCAARLCTGEILVELDHDDELTPDCCTLLIEAFRNNPNCGFAYAESTMVYEGTLRGEWYGWDFGFGYGTCWKQWVSQLRKASLVVCTADLNWKTVRHLVGLPNHPRAWLRECYDQIGAHRPELSVADDFDMIIRTILYTDVVKIPHLSYIQYINAGRNNFTAIRNKEIQILCKQIEGYYHERINERLRPLVPELPSTYARVWTLSESIGAHFTDYTDLNAHILVDPSYAQIDQIPKLLETGDEVVVVSPTIPSQILQLAPTVPDGRLRWWRMEIGTYEERVRYAKMISSASPENHIIHELDRGSYPIVFSNPLQFALELIHGQKGGYKMILVEMNEPILKLEETQEKIRKIPGYETLNLCCSEESLDRLPEPTLNEHPDLEAILLAMVYSDKINSMLQETDLIHFACLNLSRVEIPHIDQEYVEMAMGKKYARALDHYLPEGSDVLMVGNPSGLVTQKQFQFHLLDQSPLMEFLLARRTQGLYIGVDTPHSKYMCSERERCIWIDPTRLHLPLRVEDRKKNGSTDPKGSHGSPDREGGGNREDQ